MLRRRTMFGGGIEDGGGADANCVSLYHFDNNAYDTMGNYNLVKSQTTGAGYSSSIKKFGTYAFYPSADGFDYYADNVSLWRQMLSGDFTIDYWMRGTRTGYYDFQLCLNPSTSYWLTFSSFGTYYRIRSNPNSFIGDYTFTFNSTTWYHIAIVRKNGVLSLYINGTLSGTWNFPWNPTASYEVESSIGYRDGSGFNYLDEVRFSNVARWTSNFTPPTAPYA